MVFDEMTTRLAAILQVAVTVETMPLDEWGTMATGRIHPEEAGDLRTSIVKGRKTLFRIGEGEDSVTVIAVANSELTPVERGLIEWSIEAAKQLGAKSPTANKSALNKRIERLREWLLNALNSGEEQVETPADLVAEFGLNVRKIPLLLTADSAPPNKTAYSGFLKVLQQFFGSSVTLLPLEEREWLMLAPGDLVGGEREEETDAAQDELHAIAMGLHEMLAADWDFESHVSVHYPIVPDRELVAAVRDLRETIAVGRTYRVGSNVHSPWHLRLETLLHAIPEGNKTEFLRVMLSGKGDAFDPETLATLEAFFEQDCSVSETAKQLYIHRNTLLYRLDKFKHETGLDVRAFQDAVLVKIAISLYKVTKRKL